MHADYGGIPPVLFRPSGGFADHDFREDVTGHVALRRECPTVWVGLRLWTFCFPLWCFCQTQCSMLEFFLLTVQI